MQIKMLLIVILVSCSYLLGEYIYNTYTKRHKHLNDLIRILEIMRMDLSFGLYTLEEIFLRISEKKEYCFYKFFKSMGQGLGISENNTLEELIEKNIGILKQDTYLSKGEIDELIKLINSLGKSDIYLQERIINLSIENLKKMTEETERDVTKKGLVYKKLTTILGLVVGIILI